MKQAAMADDVQFGFWDLLNNRMLQAMVLLICLWSVYRLLNLYMLPIEKLYVTGKVVRTSADQIQHAVIDNVAYGFFAVDLEKVRMAVENLRWVQNVTVKRVWPNALQININEHVAVAKWGQTSLINQRGKLFLPDQMNTKKDENLPVLIGPKGMHQYLYGQLQELQSILENTGLEIAKLVYDSRHAMKLTTRSGIAIRLGRLRNVTDSYVELMLFAHAYRDKLKERKDNIVSIDLRYTNGFAIKWRNGIQTSDKHLT